MIGVTGAVREQVQNGDRRARRFRVVERATGIAQHARRGQFRQPVRHRRIEPQAIFLDQHHDRGARDRLRHRRDAKQGGALHRQRGGFIARAERVDMCDFAVTASQRHDPGYVAPIDIALHGRGQPRQARGGESCFLHEGPCRGHGAASGFGATARHPASLHDESGFMSTPPTHRAADDRFHFRLQANSSVRVLSSIDSRTTS